MSFPGAILMGAQKRLLPVSVPYRFFLGAAAGHVLAWLLLALAADQVPGYGGGPGPVLAVVHALTLGVFAATAMGASFQMLPVATGQELVALWPCRLAFWLLFPGALVLLAGFHLGKPGVMAIGAGTVSLAFLPFAWVVGDLLWKTRGILLVLRFHAWTALAALGGLALLGLALIADYDHGFLPDRSSAGLAHLILAVFGFMGFLAFGYSHILVPMFALSPASDPGRAKLGYGLALAALLAGVSGALSGISVLLVGAAILGLAATGVHLHQMRLSLKTGMRKNLGLSFVLVKTAWGLLPLTLTVGGLAAAGGGGGRMVALFGFLALFGWLLTFLTGILQRIVPFLASMNAGKGKGGRTPRLSELAAEGPLKVHAACHFAALALGAVGIGGGWPAVIQGAASIGLAGAAAFFWFVADVYRRLLRSRAQQQHQATETETDVLPPTAHPADPA
ncbi:MAG: hypothetical protein H7841_06675 [Magnetospirillum sp. WYHS-4]